LGDVFVASGQIEQARVAYDKAIARDVNAGKFLRLKRQDLGTPEFGATKTDASKPEATEANEPKSNESESDASEPGKTEQVEPPA
jgi:hypothetical protein